MARTAACVWRRPDAHDLGLLAGGMTTDEILAEHPSLALEDVRACLAYGARLSVGHYVDVA
jgi:uncharacterized protein (DUF433 family)